MDSEMYMSKSDPDIHKLGDKIARGKAKINEITIFINSLMPETVNQVNSMFAPRQLAKRDRTAEPLPTGKRQLSSYRTRIGTMLEYALSKHMDDLILKTFGFDLRLTFAVAHEYPDFFVRDAVLGKRVQIEMKAVDADSDEQSARFEVLSSLINAEEDLVVLMGWAWRKNTLGNGTPYEYPEIFSYVVVPAIELARERDTSVVLRGGRVNEKGIFVPSKKHSGNLTPDPHNAGKILRLVHKSRKADLFNLSAYIQAYLQFVDSVSSRARKQKLKNRTGQTDQPRKKTK
jgi:hypothetical protein